MNVTDTPQTDTTQTEGAGPVVVAVAIVSADGVLGDGTDQPWHLREDQKRFKDLTRGHPVVVGRATFDTFGGPLPGRPHVVVTRDRDWSYPGVRVAHDPHEALRMAKELPGGDERVGIIGGGQIYEALLPQTDVVELTEVDADAPGDVRFPQLSPQEWTETRRDDRLAFAFVTYERRPSRT